MTVKVSQIIGAASFISKREISSSEDNKVLITSGISPGVVSLKAREESAFGDILRNIRVEIKIMTLLFFLHELS